MTSTKDDLPEKVHPATREMLPDDPMQMQGFEVPGDPHRMLQLLVEEYARIGWNTEAMVDLAREPNYQAFHAFYQMFGEDGLRRRVANIVSRCGVIRVKTEETEPISERLVQIEISAD
jgi:hypothetical protein